MYAKSMMNTIADEMIKGKTAEKALAIGKEKHGKNDYWLYKFLNFDFLSKGSEFRIYGDKKFTFKNTGTDSAQPLLPSENSEFTEKLCSKTWTEFTSEVGDVYSEIVFSEDGNVNLTFEHDMGDPDKFSSKYTANSDGSVSFSYKAYGDTIKINLWNTDSQNLVRFEIINSGGRYDGMLVDSSKINISDDYANELDGETYYSAYLEEHLMSQGVSFSSDENGNYECLLSSEDGTALTVIGVADGVVRLVDYGYGNGYLIFLEKSSDDNEYINAYIFDNGNFITEQWTK